MWCSSCRLLGGLGYGCTRGGRRIGSCRCGLSLLGLTVDTVRGVLRLDDRPLGGGPQVDLYRQVGEADEDGEDGEDRDDPRTAVADHLRPHCVGSDAHHKGDQLEQDELALQADGDDGEGGGGDQDDRGGYEDIAHRTERGTPGGVPVQLVHEPHTGCEQHGGGDATADAVQLGLGNSLDGDGGGGGGRGRGHNEPLLNGD